MLIGPEPGLKNGVQQYRIKERQVKEACRRDKRAYINQVAADAEEAASKGDLKRLYQTTRILSGRKPNQSKPIRNKEGDILAKADEKLARWKEHFEDHHQSTNLCCRTSDKSR